MEGQADLLFPPQSGFNTGITDEQKKQNGFLISDPEKGNIAAHEAFLKKYGQVRSSLFQFETVKKVHLKLTMWNEILIFCEKPQVR